MQESGQTPHRGYRIEAVEPEQIEAWREGCYACSVICKLVVETPVNLSSRQKELLQELEESFGGKAASKHKPRSEGFFDGVKKFFDDLTG